MTSEKLKELGQLRQEYLNAQLTEELSRHWNFFIFVIKKKCKIWRKETDLIDISKVIEPMSFLQDGNSLSSSLPKG